MANKERAYVQRCNKDFFCSIGNASIDTIRHYIECQGLGCSLALLIHGGGDSSPRHFVIDGFARHIFIKLSILLFALLCGCNVAGQNGVSSLPEPDVQETGVENSPVAEKEDVELSTGFLPPQFFLQAHWPVSPGNKTQVSLDSRLAGELEIRVYSVSTPVIFLSEIDDFSSVSMPPEIRKALASARGQASGYWDEPKITEAALGEFALVKQVFHHVSTSKGKWKKETLELPVLPEGLYLVEGRLGPQVAYLPLLVSSLSGVPWRDEQGAHLWLTNEKGPCPEFPFFYNRSDGNWVPGFTGVQGVADMQNPERCCFLARRASQIYARWLPSLPRAKIWTDHYYYRPGDTIVALWKRPAPSQLELLAKSGTKIACGDAVGFSEFLAAAVELPAWVNSGRYLLRAGELESEILISAENRSLPHRGYLELSAHAFPTGSTVSVTSWRADGPRRRAELFYRDEKIDSQERVCRQGKCDFFFPVNRPGHYRVVSQNDSASFYVYDEKITAPHTLLIKHYMRDMLHVIELLVPGRNVPQMIVVTAKNGQTLEQRKLPPFQGNRRLSFAVQSFGKKNIFAFYAQKGQMTEEKWQIPCPMSKALNFSDLRKGVLASAVVKFPTHCFCLSVSSDIPGPVFSKSLLVSETITARAITLAPLYRQWVRDNFLEDYSQALLSYRKGEYSRAMEQCFEILQTAPGNPQAAQLLIASLENPAENEPESNRPVAPDSMARLERKVTISGKMTLWDFLAEISAQTGVCVEMDPKASKNLPNSLKQVSKMPPRQPAISLLNYVLTKRGLVYQVEHGILYIKDADVQTGLDDLDYEIDKQLLLFEQTQEKTPANARWQSGKSTQVNFPKAGVWCVRLITAGEKGIRETWQPVLVLPQKLGSSPK